MRGSERLRGFVVSAVVTISLTATSVSGEAPPGGQSPELKSPAASPQENLPSSAPALSPKEIVERTRHGIVLLETRTAGDGGSQGSGFLIDPRGYVATNFHVIHDACAIQASVGKEATSSVFIVHVDPIQDVAILKVSGLVGTPVALGSADDLSPGSRVVAIGYPLAGEIGREITISDGIYSGTTSFGEGRVLMRVTAPISPGSSGGPLFDEQGKVVGITTSRMSHALTGAQNMNLAVPIDVVRRMELSEEGRSPADSCREWGDQKAQQVEASDPTDDRVALATFKQLAATIARGIRAGSMIKESDRAEVWGVQSEPTATEMSMTPARMQTNSGGPPTKYKFTLRWYTASGEDRFNVYSVDPQLSIVTTFMGYVEIPVRTYRQKITLVTDQPGQCDGNYYRECIARGAKIKKEKAARSVDTSSVWGLSYQEGRWQFTRVIAPDEVRGFLKSVTESDRDRIYRAIVGPQQ